MDVVWRDEKVIVELDGWSSHRTRDQFAEDRRRDRELASAGWIVLRYTWADIDKRAARQIRALLTERTAPRSGRPRSAVQLA